MDQPNLQFFVCLSHESPERVIKICMDLGLIAHTYVCPKCGKDMSLRPRQCVIDKFEWTCPTRSAPSHEVRRSVRSGTYFERSKLSIPTILLLTHLMVKLIDHNFIMEELNLSSCTVCDWHVFIREVCVEACLQMNHPIGGPGVIVEIIDSEFGKRKFHRGKHIEGMFVFGGVERGSNKCFFKVVEKRDRDTLLDIIKTSILPGTIIYSECWRSYDCLSDEGFRILAVIHSISFQRT